MLNKPLNLRRPRHLWVDRSSSRTSAPTFWPFWALLGGHLPASRPLWADRCHQSSARQVDVSERQRGERPAGVLFPAAIANLRKTPQSLDHREDMLHARADLRLVAVLAALHLIDLTAGTAR